MRKIEYAPTAIPLQAIIAEIESSSIVFNKTYQREYVWKKKMKEELIFTIFKGMPIGSILIWDTGVRKEIIDGLQRLHTLKDFVNGQFSLDPILSRKIMDDYIFEIEIENTKDAKFLTKKYYNNENIRLKYEKLPLKLKRVFDIYLMSVVEIRHASLADIMSYFARVQNQERLKGGEIIKTLPNNELIKNLQDLELDELASGISFNNKRQELLKMIVMFHGINEDKLDLNSPESRILAYANSTSIIDQRFIGRVKGLIYDFSNSDCILKTKAELKLLLAARLLTSEFDMYHSNTLGKCISELVSDSKIIHSNDPLKQGERMKYIEGNPEKYSIVSLFKGSHSLKNVLLIMKKLKIVVEMF